MSERVATRAIGRIEAERGRELTDAECDVIRSCARRLASSVLPGRARSDDPDDGPAPPLGEHLRER